MSLRIRRGTETQRTGLGYTFDPGELVYTTDSKKLYIGDGVTVGGQHVLASSAGTGLYWNPTTQQLDISGANLSTAFVQEDPSNLYFTSERAQDAASVLFTHSDGHSGISFVYDDVNNKIYATVTGGGSGTALPGNAPGLLYNDGAGTLSWTETIVEKDSLPMLGGNLDLNSHSITGIGSINIDGSIGNSLVSLSYNTFIGTSGIEMSSNERRILKLNSITDGTFSGAPQVIISASKGTIISPTTVSASDNIGALVFQAYNGTENVNTGGILSSLSSTADVSQSFPDSELTFIVGTNSNQFTSFNFNYKGVLQAPIFKATSYDASSLPTNPEAGWIIYDSTNNQFKGWNGSSWVLLG